MMRNDTRRWADDYAPNNLSGRYMPISVEVAAGHGHARTAAEGDAAAREALQNMLKAALPGAIAKTQTKMKQVAVELRADAHLRFEQAQELCDKVDGWLQNRSERHGHAELTIPLAMDQTRAAEAYNASQKAVIDAAEKIRQKKLETAAAIEKYSENFAESDIPKQIQELMADDTLPVRDVAKEIRNLLRILAGRELNGFESAFLVESGQSSVPQLNKVLEKLNSDVEEALSDWQQHFTLLSGYRSDKQAISVREQFDTLSKDILKEDAAVNACHQKLRERGPFMVLSDRFDKLVTRHFGEVTAAR